MAWSPLAEIEQSGEIRGEVFRSARWKKGRPQSTNRKIFLRILPPHRPFKDGSILNCITSARLRAAGVHPQGRKVTPKNYAGTVRKFNSFVSKHGAVPTLSILQLWLRERSLKWPAQVVAATD